MQDSKTFKKWVMIVAFILLLVLGYAASSRAAGSDETVDRQQLVALHELLLRAGVIGTEAKFGEMNGSGYTLVMGRKNELCGAVAVRTFEGEVRLESLALSFPLTLSKPFVSEEQLRQAIYAFFGGSWSKTDRTGSVDPCKADRWIEKSKRAEEGKNDFVIQYEYGFRQVNADWSAEVAPAYLLALKVFSWPVARE